MATAVSPGTAVRICCLGHGVVLLPDGSRAPFRTRKHLALLLLLARGRGRSASRDQLVELLWSQDGEKQGRHSLSQAVSLINKALRTELISVAGGGRLALAEGAWELDVARFEQLAAEGRHAEARALWTGTLLEGAWIRRAPNFERWLGEERDRLERVFRLVVQAIIEQRRTEGDYAAMRVEAETLLALDPLDEGAMLACLVGLSLGGHRTLALRRYAEFERRLRQELEAEPGARLKSWARRHRRGDAEPPLPPLPLRVQETPALPAVQPFFGRAEEFRQLWESWERAQAGSGCFWIVEGEAGIGKTALAGKLANQAHVAGASVCYVKCYRTEKSVPFAPISALIRQLSRLPGFLAMSATWIGELTRLVPELRERFPHAPQPMAVDDSARFRLCDATVHAAECVSDEQPLMIVVDDVHDADEATLALLHFLGRQAGARPIMLLVTFRHEPHLPQFVQTFVVSATSTSLGRALQVPRMHPDGVQRLVAQLAATRGLTLDSKQVEAVGRQSSGNPLHAIEAVLARPGLDEVDESTQPLSGEDGFFESAVFRVARLPGSCQRLATTLAIAGRPLSELDLARVTGLSAVASASALIHLERAKLVRRSGEGVLFTHEKYADAIASRTTQDERRRLHEAVANVLSAGLPANPALHHELARHYEAARRPKLCASHARAAADHAAAVGATRSRKDALETLARIDKDPAEQLSVELAQCYHELGDLEQLTLLVERVLDKEVAPNVARALRYYLLSTQWMAGSCSLSHAFNSTLELLTESDDPFPERARAELLLMRMGDKVQAYSLVKQAARRLRHQARREYGALTADALFACGYVYCKYFWPSRALKPLQMAMTLTERSNDWWLKRQLHEATGIVLKMLGRYAESIDEFECALGLARRAMDSHAEVAALNNRAVSEMAMGAFSKAEATHAEADRIGNRFADWTFTFFRRYNQALIDLYRGRLSKAISAFQASAEECERGSFMVLGANACAGQVLAYHRLGSRHQMLDAYAQLQKLDPNQDDTTCDWIRVAAVALVLALEFGQPIQAIARVESACRLLARRDVALWLALELELIFLREAVYGSPDLPGRGRLRTLATRYCANGIVSALGA